MPHDLAAQLLARPRQIAQVLDRLRRDEARPDQAVRQQVRDPGRIIYVALATRPPLDVRRVSPHWFWHAHGSHSLDRGAPIHLVQQTLGHASVATTGRYLHARPSDSSARYLGV